MEYGTSVPVSAVIPLDPVAPGVWGLQVVMVNVYAVQEVNHPWVLIDAGLPYSANRIRQWAARHFGPTAKPAAILLTHGHFDHVGALQTLAEEWDVPVYAHRLEMPYLNGRSSYPPPDPHVGGGIMPALSPLYPRGPINLAGRLRQLPDDGTVPEMPGWQWVHTPGHASGHVSFFRGADQVLIAGDAFVTVKQESLLAILTQRPEMHGPPAYFTPDWQSSRTSVERLAALRPMVMATGHGKPLHGMTALVALQGLAHNFDEIARPVQGRYTEFPALADERGVISIPPPVAQANRTAWTAGLAVAGLAGLYWLARSRRAEV